MRVFHLNGVSSQHTKQNVAGSPLKGLPLALVLFLPPKVEVRDLGPDELAVGVGGEGVRHEAQDVACLATVVLLKGLYPAGVVVGVRYDKHLREKTGRRAVGHSRSPNVPEESIHRMVSFPMPPLS